MVFQALESSSVSPFGQAASLQALPVRPRKSKDSAWKERGRMALVASLLLGLAACGSEHPSNSSKLGKPTVVKAQRVGLMLPLTGPRAAIGQRMRQAALLALPVGQQPPLDIFDSNAAPASAQGAAHKAGVSGAQAAARKAVAAGDSIVLGPLLGGATEQAADVLQPAGVPELAFTSDSQQARPGVWVLGLTLEQQVDRLVQAAVAEGRHRFAAFLPESPMGHAMSEALVEACQRLNLAQPKIVFHDSTPESVTQGMEDLSEIAIRRPPNLGDGADPSLAAKTPPASVPSAVDPVVEEDTAEALEEAPREPVTPPKVPVAPPPFDTLLLGDTGVNLARVIAAMQKDDVSSTQVRVLGPALWRSFDSKLGALKGAWYAALDTRQRGGYVKQYTALYHQPPSPVTDFSYDAAALAGALIRQKSLSVEHLTDPEGFTGVNGWFRLLPNGHVVRGLNIYQIMPGGGAHLVSPAPTGPAEKAVPAVPTASTAKF